MKTNNKRLTPDEWAEVADLLAQCVDYADTDNSYTRRIRDRAISMLKRMIARAMDNTIREAMRRIQDDETIS